MVSLGQLQTRRVKADWKSVAAEYRQTLYGKGAQPKEFAPSISEEKRAEVMLHHGKLSLPETLRCRLRAFTDGAVLGSRGFVLEHLAAYRARTGRRLASPPQPLGLHDPDTPLFALRGCPSGR